MKKIFLTILFITSVIFISKAQTWLPTGLSSEIINCMSVEGTTLFVGTNNGVFKSVDFGVSWTNISNGISNLTINAFDVDGLTMYAGTNGGGVFLSTDGGLNWAPVNTGLTNLTINAVMISGSNVLLGDGIWGGLYISSNNGANWNMVNGGSGIPTNVIQNFGSIGPNLVVNALGSGIYVSTDNGLNWTVSTLINTTTNYLYGFTTDGTHIYVGSAGDGVLLSTDNGLNFTKKYIGPNIGIRNLAFNGSVAYGTDPSAYGVNISTDSCTSFSIHNTGLPNFSFFSIKKCGSFIFSGNKSGLGVWKLPITLQTCNISSNFNVLNNGNGNYSFSNISTGNFNQSHWAFGDGTTSTASNVNHTFNANGTYVIVLAVNNSIFGASCVDYYMDTITVTGVSSPVQCSAGFVIYPDISNGGFSIVNSSTGNNLNFLWDFGDGTTSTMQFPSHTYTTSGPFYLCLTVDDGVGCNNTYCDSIGSNGVIFKQAGFAISVISTPIITGLDNSISLSSEIKIYPNPTSSNLTIISDQLIIDEINIIDITGKTIQTFSTDLNNIFLDNIPNGIYFIKITANQKAIFQKFVKQ